MANSIGLQRLTEYLHQTRRQAELSISVLTEQIEKLTAENHELKTDISRLTHDRDRFQTQADRLEKENTKKWKLHERDDWKSLVDSVQSDRTRLQNEKTQLSETVIKQQERIDILEREIHSLRQEIIRFEKSHRASNDQSDEGYSSPHVSPFASDHPDLSAQPEYDCESKITPAIALVQGSDGSEAIQSPDAMSSSRPLQV
jgi:phage shock protein A